MTTRTERLNEFTTKGVPAINQPVQLLCEDRSGTYALPFACHWSGDSWINTARGVAVEMQGRRLEVVAATDQFMRPEA